MHRRLGEIFRCSLKRTSKRISSLTLPSNPEASKRAVPLRATRVAAAVPTLVPRLAPYRTPGGSQKCDSKTHTPYGLPRALRLGRKAARLSFSLT